MHGYSDRTNHALAFAAKYYGGFAPAEAGVAWLAHPANVAVILTRYSCDHVTVEAGILHHVLEVAPHDRQTELQGKIADKFGPVVLAVAMDAVEPKVDRFGDERPWQACKRDHLGHLANAEPRALDIIAADEIHTCGSTMTALRRLGVEYLRTVTRASSAETMWWYRSALEILSSRTDWPRRDMLAELRQMSADLVRGLRRSEETL